jgi:hypothetical protein
MKHNELALWARGAALAVLGTAALAVAAAEPAQATRDRRLFVGQHAELARLLSPSDDAVVTGRRLRATVRVSPSARRFRVWLDGRDVTARFRRSGGGRRVARLTAPRRRGHHYLVVRTADGRGRRDFEEARFSVVRRRHSLLTVSAPGALAADPGATRGPLGVTLRLARDVDRVVLRLNGHPVRFGHVAGRLGLRLSADEGLRFGRNRLHVRAHRETGHWDVEHRVIVVPRSHPLAAAGRDRTVRGRGAALLDATGSLPAGRGRDLDYRWTVLRRPEGSRPRLSSAGGVRPRLRFDRPGRYRVAVTVREGARRSRDVMAVVDQPDYPPIGAAFDTGASVGSRPAIRIGTQTHRFNDIVPYMLVLDRRTLEVVDDDYLPETNWYPAYMSKLGPLASRAAQERTQYLAMVVVRPPDKDYPFGYSRIDRLTWDPAHPISDDGGLENNGHSRGGAISGYLQLDNQGYYTPVRTPFQVFRTGTRPGRVSPVAAFVTVGNTTEARCEADPKSPTFMVLPYTRDGLDEDIGLPTGWCYHVNGGSQSQDQSQQEAMAKNLQTMRDHGDLVFIQSIGNPRPTTPSWGKIAAAIESLGGSATVFNELDGSGPYALVGCKGCEWPQVIESSFPETHTKGDGYVAGTLGLDDHSLWTPLVGDGQAALDYSLLPITYQPPSPWPVMDTAGRQAAYAWIWDRAKHDPGCGGCDVFRDPPQDRQDWCQPVDDLRATYCSDTAPLGSLANWLSSLQSPGGTAPNGDAFSGQDFKDVKIELVNELGHRETVRNVFTLLQRPLERSGANTLEPRDIADQIKASLIQQPSDADRVAATLGGVLVGGLEVLSSFPEFEELEPLAAITSVSYEAAGELADDENGEPALDIDVAARDIGYEMTNRLDETRSALDRIEEIILSDGAKLTAVATRYAGNKQQADDLVPKLKLATTQWLWQELLPRAWGLFKFAPPPPGKRVNDLTCPTIIWEHPWEDQSDGMSFHPVTGFNADMSWQREWWAQGNIQDIYGGSFTTPGGSMYDHFFDPPASETDFTRPGMDKNWFFRRAKGWRFVSDWVADGQRPNGGSCWYSYPWGG